MANYNLIESTKNAELVTGTSNSDSIIIGGNNVTVNASGGGDIIRLNGGHETTSVNGGKYDSTIWEDTDITNFVYGEGGNDSIYFNQSHVNANGGAGNDYFYFGQNRNDITITGGTGKDTVEINLVNNLEVVVTDFSNDDALFINEYLPYWSWDNPIYYSDSNSTRRVITQRVENGNVIISDNSSITSSGNDTVSKNITPKFSITLQGVSDISEVADAEYFIYDTYNKKFTKHSTLGELFGVESSGTTSTDVDDDTEDDVSTETTTTSTKTETTTNKTTTTTEIETTTKKTTATTSTSTPTVTSGSGSGDTIINNNYYGDYYDMSKNNGTIVNQSSVEGGVTNNTSVDNSTTIIRYGNIYTYNGGNKTINDYVEGQVVELKSDYQGIDVNGNNFLVKSSSGDLSIQNSRDKFIGYSANNNNNVVAYSYVASGGGQIDGRGKSQAEIMIGGDHANNQIYAGSGGSSLWGGNGGADTLTGGDGYDEFFFAMGSGNDLVQNASDNDVVNLLGVSLSQISSFSYDSSSVDLNFNNGEHLKVESTSSVGYRVENQTFYFNRATNQWANK